MRDSYSPAALFICYLVSGRTGLAERALAASAPGLPVPEDTN